MQPAAATTVGEWVAQLDPRPPVALHERLTALLAPGANRPVADVAEICVDTGVRLLDEMLASEATDRAHALDLLAVDALITYEPVASTLLAGDAHRLFDSRRIPETIFDVLAVHRDWLDVHRKALTHLIAVHFRGLHALQRNPGDTAFRLARRLGLPGQAVMPTFRGLSLPGIDANRAYLDPGDSRLRDAARRVSDLMLRSGQLGQPASLDGLTTPRFLPAGVRP